MGIRDDAYADIPFAVHHIGFANGQTDAIDTHRTFVHAEIAAHSHLTGTLVLKAVVPTALCFFDFNATRCLIHMPLHDMSVKAFAKQHGALEVYPVAFFRFAEIGAVEGLLHSGHGIEVALHLHHSEAHTIVRDRLVNLQRLAVWVAQGEVLIGLFLLNLHDLSHCFYYS